MTEILFYISGIVSFFVVFGVFVFAPTKGQTRIWLWSFLKIIFFGTLFASWFTENVVLKWILIEASTLFGALLISSSGTGKSFQVGWKFLLINSYGLGIAFLGIVLLLFASTPLHTLDFSALKQGLEGQSGLLIETALLLTIYGYSAKLGLVPNHYWVGDTYAESPSQISSLIASFVPVSVVLAIRPFVQLEREINPSLVNSSNGLLFIGVLTILYATWILHRRDDIRRIAAKVALFHTGMLSVFLWFNVSDEVFYFLLASTVVVKVLVFVSMGILRMDSGQRMIPQILQLPALNLKSFYAYFAALLIAFVFPLSPVFILDLEIIRTSLDKHIVWLFFFPLFGSVFFFIALNKILPILRLKNREFAPELRSLLRIRLGFFFVGLLLALFLGTYGMYVMIMGGFGHV
ncbi:proton-conducting transporter membrane subunit [Leptospira idonii]|uniref:Formate hydrogenase n=1 Tax=Leptospira idonii TaxID=1193500 RepID=A0A4R9LUX8_9LEPT|nr:proton-conducting transporter membrane subunit [Leptospira idonii]TGN17879.1 formate hydrogenase [Leptospira idonii]